MATNPLQIQRSDRNIAELRTLSATVKAFEAGRTEMDAQPYALVCMHLGPSVEVSCIRGGTVRQGREVAGDLDIIPAHTPSARRPDSRDVDASIIRSTALRAAAEN